MTTKPLPRRDFLKAAGLTLAGATVACSGLGYAATRTPEIETPEFVFEKDDNMNERVLIAYATRAGSTPEIAAAIGETLAGRGYAVDVKPVTSKPSLNGYGAVLLGSAIRMGSWLPEMVDYIKANQSALTQSISSGLPVGLYTVHMLNTGEDPASRTARLAYLDSVRPLLGTVEEAYFTGVIDMEKLSFLDRWMVKMVKSPVGDKRDWNKIRNWAPAVIA
jgi:menaquinone-dependent protoporphyrinogen oxidase